MHQLVLASPPGDLVGFPLRWTLDNHLLDPADTGPVGEHRRPLQDLLQTFEAVYADVVVDEVPDHGRRLRPFSGGEDEAVRRVVTGRCNHFQGGFKVNFGLPGEPHDEVRGNGKVFNTGPCGRQALHVPLGGVAAVHGGQDAVAPRLEGKVQVLTHGSGLRHGHDGLRAQVLGMRAGEPDPTDAVDLTHGN